MKLLAFLCFGGALIAAIFVAPGPTDDLSPIAPVVPAASPVLSGTVLGEPAAIGPATGGGPFVPVTQEGMGWLNSPPPSDVETVGLKSEDGSTFVGIVLPPATKDGDPVETRMVAMTKPGVSASTLEGMVLVDPRGKSHTVKSGEVIAFTAMAVGTWTLLDKDGKTVAKTESRLDQKVPDLWKTVLQTEAIVCQPGSAIVAPGEHDGVLTNTRTSNARVIAENPRSAVLVVDEGARSGKATIDITEGDKTTSLDCYFVRISATGTQTLRIGDPGLLTIRVNGLEGMTSEQAAAMKNRLAVRYRNATPEVIGFGPNTAGTEVADFTKVSQGALAFTVPFKALAPGRFTINTWLTDPPLTGGITYCQGFQCCSTACAPCDSSWGFCDDTGRTNCSRIGGRTGVHCAACLGGICAHRGSAACGHWWCACPFGFCVC